MAFALLNSPLRRDLRLTEQRLRGVFRTLAGCAAPVTAPILVPRVRCRVGGQGGRSLTGASFDGLPPLLALLVRELHGAQPSLDPAVDRTAQRDEAGRERVAEQSLLDGLRQ